jgi:broad specificity phosphatase PhoE
VALLFITHPDVVVDPETPVPCWRLSDTGVARMQAFVASPVVDSVAEVWSSTETKAIVAAGLLAARFGLPIRLHSGLCENDRSATGYLPPDVFETVADAFFEQPFASAHGWETAVAAQARINKAVSEILAGRDKAGGDVAVVAHGAVGTLLLCRLLGEPIARKRDQPFQGHYWRFEPARRRIMHGWRPIAPRGTPVKPCGGP